jgi:hypothetical protein
VSDPGILVAQKEFVAVEVRDPKKMDWSAIRKKEYRSNGIFGNP